ncbi:hypothetical protein KBY93_11030 [Synechococcus sp. J7-Johnson]|uniref:hypothetical protein n=1 Tax=Synechococcus sp. J7-Johnson TaxID=2823737 RepID=UPI0020CBA5AA|nr:hypothetical protein [Synechococcus sp. J7-Johnson]MCP9841160.1 hypothetical protein [Synechococcus sp. J7-Johnson]
MAPAPVLALPGEDSSELQRNWRAATTILPRPQFEQKTAPDYPDLSSQGSAAGGRLIFTAFLNSNRISESETIDYRPDACENNPYCSGQVIFEKSGNELGHLLIADIFGSEVLDDFVKSVPVRTFKDPGDGAGQVTAFYAGRRFNYTTFVHSEPGRTRTISHFTVLLKDDAELQRQILLMEACAKPGMERDPLCNAP